MIKIVFHKLIFFSKISPNRKILNTIQTFHHSLNTKKKNDTNVARIQIIKLIVNFFQFFFIKQTLI
ncbi:unnamed protein product [Paramecium sonneborni]|uniref:Uncharacterized protein n=1 Tax=Paramecium sonneborni TaxID=65129 RepID=A0A8S1NK94_9CILI|nr:unnamed protein product [Paramecium sonneborni]